MVLQVEGHPHQPLSRGRQQQRADRAVDGAVGHVEDAGAVGSTGELGVQVLGAGHVGAVTTAVEGGLQVTDDPTVRWPGWLARWRRS